VSSRPIIRQLPSLALVRPQNSSSQDLKTYFGPGVEVAPIAPRGTEARGWNYWPFFNQNFIPRPDAVYTAPELRSLSRYVVARICIENCKDVISAMSRQVRAVAKPGESNRDRDKRSAGDSNLKMLNEFFDCPDGEHDWGRWSREWLEGVYVGDWASVYVRRMRNGRPRELRVIDGAFINRQIDDLGFTPKPPLTAYQQLWSGTPATIGGIPYADLTTDDLIYWPRNIVPGNTVSSYLYGYSPTEQLAEELKLGQARLNFVLAYYTDGTIPDGYHIVPPNVSPDKLAEQQKALNAEMSGQLFKRRQLRLLQGFVDRTAAGGSSGDQLIFPKDKLLADPFDDMHLRKVAFGYGSSAQRLMKQLNRASAEAGQEAAEEEGTLPIANSLRDMINWAIAVHFKFGFGVYEMTYDQEVELDAVKRSTADKNDVDSGIISRDEARVKRGLDEMGGDAAKLMITTATGTVPVDLDDQLALAQKKHDMFTPEEGEGDGNENLPSGKKKPPVGKRHTPRIDPGRITPDTRQAQAKLEEALKHVFMRQKDKAKIAAEQLLKADSPDDQADAIYKAIQTEFAGLPAQARDALEQAALAGIADAIIQLEITSGVTISSVNEAAGEYAVKRAAEMVGMKYNEEGELIANPNAKWAISDTTRDRLRQIITNAFEEKTAKSELIDDIMGADIFSENRAAMIARTEISTAQVMGNFNTWKESGLVTKVKWLAVGPDPCPICEDNDGEIREIGQPFPSGEIMPLAHPNCYCILTAVGFKS
jgi:hypothetical protein